MNKPDNIFAFWTPHAIPTSDNFKLNFLENYRTDFDKVHTIHDAQLRICNALFSRKQKPFLRNRGYKILRVFELLNGRDGGVEVWVNRDWQKYKKFSESTVIESNR